MEIGGKRHNLYIQLKQDYSLLSISITNSSETDPSTGMNGNIIKEKLHKNLPENPKRSNNKEKKEKRFKKQG